MTRLEGSESKGWLKLPPRSATVSVEGRVIGWLNMCESFK